MKKSLSLALGLLLLVFSCRQDDTLKLYVKNEIRGQALFNNSDAGTPDAIAANATVLLVDSSQPTRYLYSLAAGDDGKFTLTYQPEKPESTSLVIRYTDKGNLLYEYSQLLPSLSAPDSRGEVTFRLTPRYTKGNLKVTVSSPDGLTPLVGATVYLFANLTQAGSFSTSSPQGFINQTATNEKGIAFFSNLNNGPYWAAGKLEAQLTTLESTTVAFTSANPTTMLTLKMKAVRDILVTVRDTAGDPVADFVAHLFTNKNQAGTVTSIDPPPGAILSAKTGANGQARLSPVETGTLYYVTVVGKIGQQVKILPPQSTTPNSLSLTSPLPFTVN